LTTGKLYFNVSLYLRDQVLYLITVRLVDF